MLKLPADDGDSLIAHVPSAIYFQGIRAVQGLSRRRSAICGITAVLTLVCAALMAGAPFSAAFAQAPVRTLDAEASLKAALAARERQLGRENVELVPSLRALALHYQSKRRFAEAEALLKRVLQLQERAYGPAHPKVAATLDDLASLARKQGRAAEAQRYAKRASDIRARVGTVKPVGPLNPTLRTAKPVARPPVARPAEVEARRAAERAQQPDQSRSYRSRRVGEAREPAGGAAPPPKTSAREYRHEAPAGGSARPGGASPRSLGSPPPVAAAPPPPAASAPPPLATARPPAAAAPPVTYNRAPSPAPPAAAPAPAGAPAPPPEAEIAAEKQSDWDVVPVYFGTDREIEPDTSRVKFSSNRGRKLQLGRALVTVPKTHEVPLIERPWAIRIPYFDITLYEEAEDPNKHFTMQSIGLLSHDQFLALVRERIAASKQYANHALVFIHGYNTAFDYAVYRTAQIAYDLKFDGAPFLYSWPSGGGLASYTYDKGSVEQAEPYLRQFLNVVVKESGAKSVSIIAHSMGNELLLRVLQELRYSPPEGVRISQVILAAPDVDRDKFENIVSEIKGFAEGVTLYAAGNDRALAVSRSFNGGVPRAGDVPETGPMILQGVDTIDVTAASTDSLGLNHSSYAENNGLLKDIAALIESGVRPPDKRFPGMKLMSTPKGSYWQFPGATQ